MNVKNAFIFIGGMIVGGIAGIFGTRAVLVKKYDERTMKWKEELQEYYERTDEYARVPHENDQNEVEPKEGVSRPGGRMTPEERASVREKLRKNYEQTTNYAAMYKEKSNEIPGHIKSIIDDTISEAGLDGIDAAEKEYPKEETEYNRCKNCGNKENLISSNGVACYCHTLDDFVDEQDTCDSWTPEQIDDQNEVSEEQAFEEHQKNMNKPPKIISAEAYSNLPAYIDQQVLYFYSYDEILCDENEEMIDDPGLLVGDALTKYDFADSDERYIFVMNYAADTCYEIQKVDAAWSDTH